MKLYTLNNKKYLINKNEFESNLQYYKRCKLFQEIYEKNIPNTEEQFKELEIESIILYNSLYFNCE